MIKDEPPPERVKKSCRRGKKKEKIMNIKCRFLVAPLSSFLIVKVQRQHCEMSDRHGMEMDIDNLYSYLIFKKLNYIFI